MTLFLVVLLVWLIGIPVLTILALWIGQRRSRRRRQADEHVTRLDRFRRRIEDDERRGRSA